MPGQRRDTKHKGRNVVWSIAMDKCLIEALAIQAKNGNKIDKCFNENAYTAACISVNSRFNLNLNNQKVVNRLKTIKKRYRIMKDMLSQDGFRWNPNTKMIECEHDELWKRYIVVSRSFTSRFSVQVIVSLLTACILVVNLFNRHILMQDNFEGSR